MGERGLVDYVAQLSLFPGVSPYNGSRQYPLYHSGTMISLSDRPEQVDEGRRQSERVRGLFDCEHPELFSHI